MFVLFTLVMPRECMACPPEQEQARPQPLEQAWLAVQEDLTQCQARVEFSVCVQKAGLQHPVSKKVQFVPNLKPDFQK